MATTAQLVFDIAMALMDEVDETSGATDTMDTREYKQRALYIINALMGEMYQYSQTCLRESGVRPVTAYISSMAATLNLDDFLGQSVLPYGLAAHLVLEENPTAASFFQRRYEELLLRLGGAIPVISEDITRVYGGFESFTDRVW